MTSATNEKLLLQELESERRMRVATEAENEEVSVCNRSIQKGCYLLVITCLQGVISFKHDQTSFYLICKTLQ